MNSHPLLRLFVLVSASLCVATNSIVATTGMHAQQVSRDSAGKAVIRLTNTSSKNISAYVFAYTVVYGNGAHTWGQQLTDLLPAMISQAEEGHAIDAGSMHPGDSREETVTFAPTRDQSPVVDLKVSVDLVEYTDGSAESSDALAKDEFRKSRESRATTLNEVARVLHVHIDQAATDANPVVEVLADLRTRFAQTKRGDTKLSEIELLAVIDDLQRFPKGRVAGLDELRTYLTRLERRNAALSKSVRREVRQ